MSDALIERVAKAGQELLCLAANGRPGMIAAQVSEWENAIAALRARTPPASSTAAPAPVELTAAFKAMTPLQKWEALVLSGLIGTDEPWIEDMRQALREQEARASTKPKGE